MQLFNPLNQRERHFIRENLKDTLWIGVIGITILSLSRLLFPISQVSSVSMEPTVKEDSKALINNLAFQVNAPQRGDIVIFDSGYRTGLLEREKVRFIKRIVGLPGETIEIRDGQVYIDGKRLDEHYTSPSTVHLAPTHIPDKHYFLLGDNREESYDSRVFGAIHENKIEGRALLFF
ncbi:MAG: signal peptidase I [Cyanobacteria bacterium P01_D01_bin.56]